MKKPYLVLLVCALLVLVVVCGFMYFQQTASFMSTIRQNTASLFSFAEATSTTASTSSASATTTNPNSTVGVNTATTASTNHAVGSLPVITKFQPGAATVGTKVTILGTGFDKTINYITFGNSQNRHRSDGTADNVIASVASPDGKTLTFTVPTNAASGLLCYPSKYCVTVVPTKILPGNYPVTVENKYGFSSPQTFVVTAQ